MAPITAHCRVEARRRRALRAPPRHAAMRTTLCVNKGPRGAGAAGQRPRQHPRNCAAPPGWPAGKGPGAQPRTRALCAWGLGEYYFESHSGARCCVPPISVRARPAPRATPTASPPNAPCPTQPAARIKRTNGSARCSPIGRRAAPCVHAAPLPRASGGCHYTRRGEKSTIMSNTTQSS